MQGNAETYVGIRMGGALCTAVTWRGTGNVVSGAEFLAFQQLTVYEEVASLTLVAHLSLLYLITDKNKFRYTS